MKRKEVNTMTLNIESGKVTCSKETANYLSLVLHEAAENWRRRGADCLARVAERESSEIFNALDKIGFYDDVND
jgi:hypothetical protein